MENMAKNLLTDTEKDSCIAALTPKLVLLRTGAGISQEDLAVLIGVSRQTYGAIERKARKMSWSTYLSLVMFYDYNQRTHQMLRDLGVYPHEVLSRFNTGDDTRGIDVAALLGDDGAGILESLDEQALRSIRTMIMVEYARCNDVPGEVVVKAFDGVNFFLPRAHDVKAAKALKAIKENRRTDD